MDEVYMQQSPRLKSYDFTLVCKLNKSIFTFVSSWCDSSLFTLVTPTYTIFMLVYVYDIIVTVNSPKQIQRLISKLNALFSLK